MCTPENKTLDEIISDLHTFWDTPDLFFTHVPDIATADFDNDLACGTYMLKDEVIRRVHPFNGYGNFLSQNEVIEVSDEASWARMDERVIISSISNIDRIRQSLLALHFLGLISILFPFFHSCILCSPRMD